MFAKLKDAIGRLTGATPGAPPEAANAVVDYKGYRIRPAPYLSEGQYQIAGIIEKDTPDGVKEHRFVRADRFPGHDDAVAFTVAKAKQIVDQQGDRIFA
jgi:hypothetical protein